MSDANSLQMAIWSLTQERVEKLMKQIAEKQAEIDTLIKLSPKDIWNVDLDAFMDEWNLQLEEEVKRKKKIASITRRASQKLGIGAGKGGKGKKKRKMDGSDSDASDSDFGPAKKKPKPKKEGLLGYLQQEPVKKPSAAEALKSSSAFGSTAPQKQGTLLSHLVKKEATPQTDGASDGRPDTADSKPAPPKRGRPAASKAIKKDPVLSDDEDSDVFAAVAAEAAKEPAKAAAPSRAARGATKQVAKYNLDSDDDDDDDDLLGDVSSMVKTIGSGTNGVPMFKTTTVARPGSNGNARSGSSAGIKKNSVVDLDDDTTNYEGLMPQSSPQRPAPRNVNDTIMSSDDDDFNIGVKKPAATKLAARPAPKPKVTAAAKPVPKPKAVAKKPTAQSPAAKAYAKKHGKDAETTKPAPKKKQTTVDSDEDQDMEDAEDLANDLLSDEDEDEPTPKPAARAPAARPGRRAAAKPAKYVVSDDEADSDDASEPSFDDDDDSE
jgi:DNA topoisomerase-2